MLVQDTGETLVVYVTFSAGADQLGPQAEIASF